MTDRAVLDWQLHDQISRYEIDSGAMIRVRRAGKLLAKLDRDEFLDRLYVPRRDLEGALRERIEGGGGFLCFVGARGQGKTSVLHSIERSINQAPHSSKMYVLDIRKILANEVTPALSIADAIATLDYRLLSTLQFALFPRALYPQMIAWMLAGPPDESDEFDPQLVATLHELSQLADALIPTAATSRRQRRTEIAALLRSPATEELVILDAEARLTIRPQHVIQAAVSCYRLEHLALAYDNVDQLPANCQQAFFEYLQTLHNMLAGRVLTLVSVRFETIKAANLSASGGADAIDIWVSDESLDSYRGIAMRAQDEGHCRAVLDRRFAYARDLTSRLPHFSRPMGATLENTLTEVRDSIRARLLHMGVNKLTNYNLRAFLNVYAGFMSTLRQWMRRGSVTIEQVRKWIPRREIQGGPLDARAHIDTLFYLWLFDYGDSHGIPLVDVLTLGSSRARLVQTRPSVHHMLMTCVYNLAPPTFGHVFVVGAAPLSTVISRLGVLGFSENDAMAAVGDLCGKANQASKSMCFVTGPEGAESLTGESGLLSLTPCGAELVERVYSAAGYVWGRSYRYAAGGAEPAREQFLQLPQDQRVLSFYRYVRDMACQYVDMMNPVAGLLRSALGPEWVSVYREWFGIKREIQIERILRSASHFFGYRYRTAPAQNPFWRLRSEVAAAFEKLPAGVAAGVEIADHSDAV